MFEGRLFLSEGTVKSVQRPKGASMLEKQLGGQGACSRIRKEPIHRKGLL